MRIALVSLLCVLGSGCAATPPAADEQEALDLLDRVEPVSAYNPRVEPQVHQTSERLVVTVDRSAIRGQQ